MFIILCWFHLLFQQASLVIVWMKVEHAILFHQMDDKEDNDGLLLETNMFNVS